MKPRWLATLTIGAVALGYGWGAFSSSGEARLSGPGGTASPGAAPPGAGPQASALADDEPLARVFATLPNQGSLADFARIEEALGALEPGRFSALLQAVIHSPHPDRWEWFSLVLDQWFQRDAEAAAAWAQAKVAQFQNRHSFGRFGPEEAILRLLARHRPAEALDLVRRSAQRPFAALLLGELGVTWPAAQRGVLLETARAWPEDKERFGVISRLFSTWAADDPVMALAAMRTIPAGRERSLAFSRIMHESAKADPAQLRAQLATIDGVDPALLHTAMVVVVPPEAAGEWLRQNEDAPPAVAERLVVKWAKLDPAAAFAWAQAHGIDLTQLKHPLFVRDFQGMDLPYDWSEKSPEQLVTTNALAAAFQAAPEAALAWATSQPSSPELDRYLMNVLGYSSPPNHESALALFAQLTPAGQAQASRKFLAHQFGKNAEAARAWVESLPPGPVRQSGWFGYGNAFAEPVELPPGAERDALFDGRATAWGRTPEQAWAELQQIQDLAQRKDAFDALMWERIKNRSRTEAQKALDFLRTADLPPAWKQAWEHFQH